VIGLALVLSGAVPLFDRWREDRGGVAVAALGVSAATAGCDPVVDDPIAGNTHVGPGTNRPRELRVAYRTVPPTSGPHFQLPNPPSRRFYTMSDRPRMEQLVHSLEHGYVVVWHDGTLSVQGTELLRQVVRAAAADANARKIIVSVWDPAYGALPAGKHVVAAVWGHRVLCAMVSGDALLRFRGRFPATMAPEPDGG